MDLLQQADPEVWQAIQGERRRQQEGLEMIASENYTSPAVLAALLGGLEAWFVVLPPRYSFALERAVDLAALVVYVVVALAIAGLSGTMREAQRASRAAERRAVRQQEMMRITLASIGDAVITTDAQGIVTFLNGVAETLCGWTSADARGQPLERVFTIINESTRAHRMSGTTYCRQGTAEGTRAVTSKVTSKRGEIA